STLNSTFAADGQQLADRFEVQFDRPVDPSTFTTDDVSVVFRSPTMPLTSAGIPLTVVSVTPEDLMNFKTTLTANLTMGSPNITILGSTAGLMVGDFVAGPGIPSETRITQLFGSTAVLDKNATQGGLQTLSFQDGFGPAGVQKEATRFLVRFKPDNAL